MSNKTLKLVYLFNRTITGADQATTIYSHDSIEPIKLVRTILDLVVVGDGVDTGFEAGFLRFSKRPNAVDTLAVLDEINQNLGFVIDDDIITVPFAFAMATTVGVQQSMQIFKDLRTSRIMEIGDSLVINRISGDSDFGNVVGVITLIFEIL